MIRFQVIQKPIYVDAFEIVELLETVPNYHYPARKAKLENGYEARVLEPKEGSLKVGDLVRYDVSVDDFAIFDLESAQNNPKLMMIKITGE